MAKKVLIITASFGAGHNKAAESVAEAVRMLEPAATVKIVDYLKHVSQSLSRVAEEMYWTTVTRVPKAWKFLYEFEERHRSRAKDLQGRLGVLWIEDIVEKTRPDIILTTHFMPEAAVCQMTRKKHIPHAVVLTDYVPHPIWVSSGVDAYFVAHDAMRDFLREMGVPQEKVFVTGIPVNPKFAAPLDREKLRREFLIDPDVPAVLVGSGGRGVGPVRRLVKALVEVTSVPLQVAIMTGVNKQLAARLREETKDSRVPVKVLGYVQNVHEWMAVVDVMVTKAGGLTVSEALASGLPLIIVKPIPGQEAGNTKFLVENGAALHVDTPEDAGPLAAGILGHGGEHLALMRKSTARIARPRAAEDVARELLRMAEGGLE